ncbi:C-CAP/cofactor C-like domain-containing protein [Caenorhabditis elegans]|uniref:C-CAP/cofactor C-like domain-containing protein n=1 Tax=Caenorhabditis elegans TaxID=6239 RepID=Q3V5J2_CAEEL|nr:C-CAP/cofactor C-like domain-containing protein [Caenorhabditis elegans]CCD73883.1 C-CAP/cofactor C-like domain-containing protein [Caenorhabditis elegans]|eukprot:NP_001033383.3 TuBulin folding Cofactor C homolog [Caenorhabditis elegans]
MEASSEQILLDRKDRLIAKLEQRNEERKVQTEECLSKSEGAQIDNLMAEIKSDLEAKKSVDSQKIDRLQEFLAFSTSNRQTKTIQNFLEDVRKQKLALNSGPKFKGFSFSKTPKPAPPVVKSTEEPLKIPEIQKIPDCLSAEPSVSEHVVDGLKNTTKSISGTKGEDISLKNIDSCRLQFDFEPSIVHIRNIKNSTLIFLRCDRSLLIHDCDNVHIYVAAQQVRIHTSQNLHLHVATRGAVILEDSTKIFMYPYRLKSGSGELLNVEDNGEWRTPRDFNWLATTPSPNWKVVPEDEWTEEFIY